MLNSTESSAVNSTGAVALDTLFAGATRTGEGEVSATSCVCDWRQVEPGNVYVALPETADSEDGHQHARRAASHGAIAIICEQPVPVFDIPTYLVADSRVALGELCHALVGHPTRTVRTIGVAGTHGKSTTIAVLESIFARADQHCGTISSLGSYDGMSHSTGVGPSINAPALAIRLACMEAAGCTHAFVEISSHTISQAHLAGIQLEAICVTNVTSGHLDLHNTVQNYQDTQRRVLDYLSPTGVTVLNADDPVNLQWLDSVGGPVLTYGLNGSGEVSARIVQRHANEQLFVLTAGNESAAVRTTIVGDHHVANCLAAATLALSNGLDLQTIAAGIEAVEELPGRMQRVDRGQGFPVFVDVADTPEALRASLRTARQLATGRVICVLGDTARVPQDEVALAGVVKCLADLAIAVTPLPEIEEHGDGDRQFSAEVEVVADRAEAIACAVSVAEPGDVVVIAGSQMPSGWSFVGVPQDAADTEIASQLLEARNDMLIRLAA